MGGEYQAGTDIPVIPVMGKPKIAGRPANRISELQVEGETLPQEKTIVRDGDGCL